MSHVEIEGAYTDYLSVLCEDTCYMFGWKLCDDKSPDARPHISVDYSVCEGGGDP